MNEEKKEEIEEKAKAVRETADSTVTLTKEDMQRTALHRISEITNEFTEGFQFLDDYSKSVTFFGATLTTEDSPYYPSARTLANRIVKELGYSVITGGGPGIMEAANRGAFEAGGNSLGLTIELPQPQRINRYMTKEVDFYYFFVRKVCLAFSAEAFIFYPGGFGTMDEFFEILTLVQTHKIKGVPMICVGSDYWNSLVEFMKKEMLNRGTIIEEDLSLFTITDDLDEVINIIKKSPVRHDEPTHAGIGAALHPKESAGGHLSN
ncbi:MAG: TIGR00730 family Rossman fold protein [Parcubacteria group bacterium]